MTVTVVGLMAIVGLAVAAAPDQSARPGEMTQAKVWVQNRGDREAVPVDLRQSETDAPLRVRVMNGDARTPDPVFARLVRQTWDYDSIVIPADGASRAATLLNQRGLVGWETTGIAWTAPDGATTLLLKRLR